MEGSGRRGRRRQEVSVELEHVTEGIDRDQGSGGAAGDLAPTVVQRVIVIERAIVSASAVCLLLLFLLLAVRTTDMVMHYNSVNDNVTLERNELQDINNKLILENNVLNMTYNNLVLEINQLQSEVNQLKRKTAVKLCPSGWQKFGDSCYYRSTEKRSWEESRKQCQSTGADLVIINSEEEQEFIRGFQPGGTWSFIGLKRTEGRWIWVDGTPLKTSYWRPRYPLNDQVKNCVAFHYSSGGWDNWSCTSQRVGDYWICETDASVN